MDLDASVVIETEITKMVDTASSETPLPEKDTSHVDRVLKRRSSIFQNKLTSLANDADQEILEAGTCQEWKPTTTTDGVDNAHECHLPAHSKNNATEEEFDLAQYVNSLKEERSLWHTIVKERKSERQKLMRKKIILERESQPLDLNQLSNEERAFVQETPNYQHIRDQCSQLAREAVKIAFLNELVSKLNTDIISRLTEDLGSTTKQIIQISEQ